VGANGYDVLVAVLDFLGRIGSTALYAVAGIYVIHSMGKMFERIGQSHQRDRNLSFRMFLRRLYCRHHHVFRSHDRWGRHYTGCTRCGEDVNKDKQPEEWR
jgi:hypothetical protein